MLPPLKPCRKECDDLRSRDNSFLIRLTDEELNDLEIKVSRSGMTRERFIRKVLSDCRVFDAPPVDFYTLIREINRVGSNIEQILRLANTKGLLDVPRLRSHLDELDKIEDAMWNAFAPDGR